MSKNKSLKKCPVIVIILCWIMAVVALMVVGAFSFWNYVQSPVEKNADMEVSERFVVREGESVSQVASELMELNLIHWDKAFYYAVRFNLFKQESPFYLKSGVYRVKNTMALKDIYELLQSGQQEYEIVRIPEGLTITKIARILEDNGICSAEDFIVCAHDAALLEKYGIAAESFEGFLFPDTYYMVPNSSASDVVKKLVDTFYERIALITEYAEMDSETLYRTVTLASIVEREYKEPTEAPLISSVFSNRLRYNIGLYSCATIEYILTERLGRPHPDRITYNDLKIDDPYNTYLYAGLTPGPISNPGFVALNAAAAPAKTRYYYFVLTDPVKGTHTFSESFDEHKAAENTAYYSK